LNQFRTAFVIMSIRGLDGTWPSIILPSSSRVIAC